VGTEATEATAGRMLPVYVILERLYTLSLVYVLFWHRIACAKRFADENNLNPYRVLSIA
jgi:hypothetical protein